MLGSKKSPMVLYGSFMVAKRNNMPSYLYKNFLSGNKMILQLSYIHNGKSNTGMSASLYCNRSQVTKVSPWEPVNSISPGQNSRHFTDNIFRCIFMNEKFCILIKISLKYVSKGLINNNPALFSIMAWRQKALHSLLYAIIFQCLPNYSQSHQTWLMFFTSHFKFNFNISTMTMPDIVS